MGVPKKRKKIDKEKDEQPKKIFQQNEKEIQAIDVLREATSSEKLSKALKIVEDIEPKQTDKAIEILNNGKDKLPISEVKSGLHFQISLSAIIPAFDNEKASSIEKIIKKASMINIGITIPFIWDLPIIGNIARKIIDKIFVTIES